MPKRLLKSDAFLDAVAGLMARYIRFVVRTSDAVSEPEDVSSALLAHHPEISGMWHGQFLLLPTLFEHPDVRAADAQMHALVSRHIDAELIARMLGRFGIGQIRGAGAAGRNTDRGGGTALRAMLAELNSGVTVGTTVDVPPGPARVAGQGIAMLAALSGRPVLPAAFATSRSIVFRSWSRFTLNLPFGRCATVIGEPVTVPGDASGEELERYRQRIEQAMNAATARAYELAGVPTNRIPFHRDAFSPPGLQLGAYRLATRVLTPFAPRLLARRAIKGKEDPARLSERLGTAGRERPAGSLIWFHAVSVGETNAVMPLIERFSRERSDLAILLTTGTVTAAQIAARKLPKNAIHQFAPLDTPAFVTRFLGHWRPDIAIFAESEIWPNMILELDARRIPIILVNGRFSPRSIRRWKRWKRFGWPLFERFSLVLAQNTRLAHLFMRLGSPRAIAAGNLKYDAPSPSVEKAELDRLKSTVESRPVWVAASTHPGEEELVAEAHRKAAKTLPDLLTIIVPRHPVRGGEIADLLTEGGLRTARRSTGALPGGDCDIYIADTLGELGLFYSLAPIAFTGGSLVPHGGQNPIEPVQLGAAVLHGPHVHNFQETYGGLASRKGCREVDSAEALSRAVVDLMGDDVARKTLQDGAQDALRSMTGALERAVKEITPYLPPEEGARRAS